ncbi:cation:proton antiporter [Halostella litorea]|uniref:cation:proton antiporter n=1 Tax=Halostella litorea TaxID=2528831 RepID=UPI00109221F5|nr:cation:proton antiporter [Halostella litorea]
MALTLYNLGLVVVGLSVIGVALLPRAVSERPVSMPIFYVGAGMVAFSLPLPLPPPDPVVHGTLAEHLTGMGVILALMSAGLKLDRLPGLRRWATTWRLLAVTMPLSIAGAAALGHWTLGLAAPSALLLGAVIAPTDPVLAAEVQVEKPGEGTEAKEMEREEGMEDEVRFALTSEAGLNDGLAFPFTHLAVTVAFVGLTPASWVGEWLLVDVGYRILVGLVLGGVLGGALALGVFWSMPETPMAKSMQGLEALGGTLVVYGLTELAGGYGFIAVFVAATVLRQYERTHDYNEPLHDVAEKSEQLLMAAIMILFGGALASGLLAPMTVEVVAVAVALVLVVRPLAGGVGLLGFDRDPVERATMAFYGIRGIGSFYYLAFALNHAPFRYAATLWSVVSWTVVVSILVHGTTATPVVKYLEARASARMENG